MSILHRAWGWLLRFFDQNTEESMARLCAFLCILTGCAVALLGIALDREHGIVVGCLIGGGGVALLTRKKAGDDADV